MADGNIDPGFDPVALKAKYDAERDKRLRSDGAEQYVHLEGRFAHFLDDPYVERVERAPVSMEMEVAILGGGFSGLLAAARLHDAGCDDVLLLEKGGDFGGTWYWNRYPGAACDVESYVYLPLLEELGAMPTEKYARAPEILEHAKEIGRKFGLYEKALFQTEITELEWDEEISRWRVKTDRGDDIRARFVIMCSGHYPRPKLPGVPGLESFKGHCFHTSRWDYGYTGGNSLGGLDKLHDKSVAIIGTGATAVQCVPHLARASKQLYVFQRTPSAVDLRGDRLTDQEWANSLETGWQKARMDNFINLTSGISVEQDLIDDSWTKPMFRTMKSMTPDIAPDERPKLLELTDFEIMEAIRARIDEVVKDKATAEALKPWYFRSCKRPCFHDDYLPSFNLPNVKLVDTSGRGVERMTENGLVVDGVEYKVDCIVYATGFELAAYSGISLPIIGRGGRRLDEKFNHGAVTLHGMHSHGFPNFFILSTLQSAWAANFPHMMEEQARHIAYVITQVQARGAKAEEVTQEAEATWVAFHESVAEVMLQRWKNCTPSYYNNEGAGSPVIGRNGPFGSGVMEFIRILTEWRDAGDMEGLVLSAA